MARKQPDPNRVRLVRARSQWLSWNVLTRRSGAGLGCVYYNHSASPAMQYTAAPLTGGFTDHRLRREAVAALLDAVHDDGLALEIDEARA